MAHSEYKTWNTTVMFTVISEMQHCPGVSGWPVVLAFLQLSLAQIDGWDHPSVTGTNMGLRILKRGGRMQSVYRINDINHKRYPEILQILKKRITKMNMVSNQSNWVKLVFSLFRMIFRFHLLTINTVQLTVNQQNQLG